MKAGSSDEETLSGAIYFALFMAVGVLGGIVYVVILLKKIRSDLRRIEAQGPSLLAPFRVNCHGAP